MIGIVGKVKQKVLRLSGKMDQYQEAITFAEAGESEKVIVEAHSNATNNTDLIKRAIENYQMAIKLIE